MFFSIKPFIIDINARIPFSIIGVFLIIGSSFTTVYVTNLEEENSLNISSSLDYNHLDYLFRNVESDLARSLNYAACKSFNEIGSNPIVEYNDGYDYDIDVTGDGESDYVDFNLNVVRHQTMRYFNEYVQTNFQNNRFVLDDYIVNSVGIIDDWKDIDVKIVDMAISRSFDRPFDKADSKYHVYPVMTVNMDLEISSFDTSEIIFTKKVTISTIINNRYLLLEDMARDFEKRIKGTTSALGVDVLAGAMGLTWLRGYSQYALNTPNNIISNEWLEILTNGGILLEEGFVFNSADPFGMVFMGYKTAETVADELGYDLGGKVESLKNSVKKPFDSINFDDNYENSFNEMLPDSEMSDSISGDLSDISTSFDIDCNITDLSEEEFNNIIQSSIITDTIRNVYNALVKILTERFEKDNNWDEIQSNLQIEKQRTRRTEESRSYDAENQVDLPDGWYVYDVKLINSGYFDTNENIGSYNIIEKINNTMGQNFFNNDNYDKIILGGELWDIKRGRDVDYSWKVETNWKVYTKNETDSKVYSVSLESNDYSYSDLQIISEDVTVKFVTTDYSNNIPSIGNNNILDCFEGKIFSFICSYFDPNLKDVLKFYLDSNHIDFNDDFRDKIFENNNKKYNSGSYNDELFIESKKDIIIHNKFTNIDIIIVLKQLKQKIIENVTVSKTIREGMLPGDMVSELSLALYNKFLSYKQELNDYFNISFKSSDMFISSVSKVYYNLSKTYCKLIEDRLYEKYQNSKDEIIDSTNNAISDKDMNDCEPVDKDYDGISSDMQNADLLSGLSIPIGADMTLTRPGNEITGWSETVRITIKQNPPYFCKDFYEEDPIDQRSFNNYIKYRNLNIFSPMAGVDSIVEESFNALNDQIIGAIDSGFDEINRIQDETLRSELKDGLDSVTNSISDSIKDTLFDSIKKEKGSIISDNDLLSDEDIQNTVDYVIDSYDDDSENFIKYLNGERIKNDIRNSLRAKFLRNMQDKYGSLFLKDHYDVYFAGGSSINQTIMNAYDQAVTKTLKALKGEIIDTYESFSKKIEDKVSKKVSSSLSKFIPSGLPILPPFGWYCTINAWYIEVEGTIPEFKLLDSSNEANPNTLMGHSSQEYFRKDSPVYFDLDGDGIKEEAIGENKAIKFEYNTGTFIIVPPGKTGVGDTVGGMDEIKEYGDQN